MRVVTLHFNSRFQHDHQQQSPSLQIITHRILCIGLIIIIITMMMMMMVVTVIPPLLSSFSFILQIKNGKVKSSKINKQPLSKNRWSLKWYFVSETKKYNIIPNPQ